jgi:hypothetical protein
MRDVSDYFVNCLKDDPVRPHIPYESRLSDNSEVFIWMVDGNIEAATCVSYQSTIPTAESELFDKTAHDAAIFYTIWSYAPGAGRRLLNVAVDHIKQNKNTVQRFVTLSPKTDMARKFHLKNGAKIFRENEETVNYEY